MTYKNILRVLYSFVLALIYYVLDIPRIINLPFNYLQNKIVVLNEANNTELLKIKYKTQKNKNDVIIEATNEL